MKQWSIEEKIMNKEVIKKYKDVFDYWLDGGRVWINNSTDTQGWTLENNLAWVSKTTKYVQDDEYAELRKKICDLESELSSLKGQDS